MGIAPSAGQDNCLNKSLGEAERSVPSIRNHRCQTPDFQICPCFRSSRDDGVA
jgi:hypothetical protein